MVRPNSLSADKLAVHKRTLQANHSTVLATCLKTTPEELLGYEPALMKTEKRREELSLRQECAPTATEISGLLSPPVCNCVKITYLSLNTQTASPPRTAVPVNLKSNSVMDATLPDL